jgi:hypothetical protein
LVPDEIPDDKVFPNVVLTDKFACAVIGFVTKSLLVGIIVFVDGPTFIVMVFIIGGMEVRFGVVNNNAPPGVSNNVGGGDNIVC